jgi:predicted LPLAT superfamily acyltransferase
MHFAAVCEALLLRLRVADGRPHRCVLGPGAEAFDTWMRSGRPAFLGTFHIGDSDLTGYLLAEQAKRTVHMVRLRVWVNEPSEVLFALKEAGLGGGTVALQCDRPHHSSRSAEFEFLGGLRRFPITIYHLALIFERPVILSFGAPSVPGESILYASPAFEPIAGEWRDAALARAHAHFQDFLAHVERHLRSHPYQWLNFLPL